MAQMSWVQLSHASRSLWAKSGDESGWLNLPQHLRDSAGVARQLWDEWLSTATKQWISNQVGLDTEGTRALVAWLAGTHDIGKATHPFAAQLEKRRELSDFARRIRDAGLDLPASVPKLDWFPHSWGSAVIIEQWLCNRFEAKPRNARTVAAISGAHHGIPIMSTDHRQVESNLPTHGPEWESVWAELLELITQDTGAEQALAAVLRRKLPVKTQMILTGIVIVTDWIASNPDAFPMAVDPDQENRRREGMAAIDLNRPWQTEQHAAETAEEAYRRRFGWPQSTVPHPMQVVALDAARSMSGPSLMCIEAPMGQGKTEAALLAAEVMAATTGRGGLMVAAPTMAMSDALFTRVQRWARTAVGEGQLASMYLGHSKNTLNESFTRMPRRAWIRGIEENAGGRGQGDVIAHQWLWGRKKGILANFVVGTVDQVLFLALQSKHAMLRHLGLADKVVVVDEVHAYDEYMSSYLERALEWLAAYGAPVVLLSATLPRGTRTRLLAAYRRGLDPAVPPTKIGTGDATYPLVTTVSAAGTRTWEVEPPSAQTSVECRVIDDDGRALLTALAPVVAGGGCALVLCNTVARAQSAYELLQPVVGEDLRLLHARFIASDRVAAEQELVKQLGPKAHRDDGRPRRRVVVATQVVEQSLDLDFDVVVTDVAPTDLFLQRIGRLHRHRRPASDRPDHARVPQVMVRGVISEGDERTAPTFDEHCTLVYTEAVLLRSWAALRPHLNGELLAIPERIPHLVQQTYVESPIVPDAWTERHDAASAELDAARTEARRRAGTFQFPGPHSAHRVMGEIFEEQAAEIDSGPLAEVKGAAQVRDTDPTLEVLLVQGAPGGYRPLPWLGEESGDVVFYPDQCPEPGTARVLATSSVRLPRAFSKPWVFDPALEHLERTTPVGWAQSPVLRGQLGLVLDEDLRVTLAGRDLQYTRELGLVDLGPSRKDNA